MEPRRRRRQKPPDRQGRRTTCAGAADGLGDEHVAFGHVGCSSPFRRITDAWLAAGAHVESMPKEVEQAMEIEAIAQRYGALPSAVMAAPASLIRHYRLVSRI